MARPLIQERAEQEVLKTLNLSVIIIWMHAFIETQMTRSIGSRRSKEPFHTSSNIQETLYRSKFLPREFEGQENLLAIPFFLRLRPR